MLIDITLMAPFGPHIPRLHLSALDCVAQNRTFCMSLGVQSVYCPCARLCFADPEFVLRARTVQDVLRRRHLAVVGADSSHCVYFCAFACILY